MILVYLYACQGKHLKTVNYRLNVKDRPCLFIHLIIANILSKYLTHCVLCGYLLLPKQSHPGNILYHCSCEKIDVAVQPFSCIHTKTARVMFQIVLFVFCKAWRPLNFGNLSLPVWCAALIYSILHSVFGQHWDSCANLFLFFFQQMLHSVCHFIFFLLSIDFFFLITLICSQYLFPVCVH